MGKLLTYSGIMLILIFMFRCRKDFIVENIDGKTLQVNAPANNVVTPVNSITFWWEPLDGAERYTLQIVQPDFTKIVQLIVDTQLVATKFSTTLVPGKYQWRIKGTNAGHSTAFQTFNLTIDTSSNLNQQTVNPLFPLNGFVTGNPSITLSWAGLPAAKQYQVLINDGTISNTLISGTSFSFALPAVTNSNTVYSWKVKALNDFSASQFNSAQTFTVDKVPPQVSALLSPTSIPAFAPSLKNADTLKWERSTVTNIMLDAKYDSLFVATDSLFSLLNIKVQMRINKSFAIIGQLSPALPYSQVGTPYYYWRVNSVDSAGNRSAAYSNFFKFSLVQ